jgi:hypothetical protein
MIDDPWGEDCLCVPASVLVRASDGLECTHSSVVCLSASAKL